MLTTPNKFPTVSHPNRIALIGECPNDSDILAREPFVGTSGQFLARRMSEANHPISCCFKGYICQQQPPENRITNFKYTGDEIQSGLAQLTKDIAAFNPNIVVLLGMLPLKVAKDFSSNHPLIPKAFKYKISQWRGSLFTAVDGPFIGRKCIATFNPTHVMSKGRKNIPLMQFDIRRAVAESSTPTLTLPRRFMVTQPTFDQCLSSLRCLRASKAPIALDIEGGINSWSCISFATLESLAFIVPFVRKDGSSVWSPEQECQLWREAALVLEDPDIPKILQNALYECFVLQYCYHIIIRNVVDDTMLKHWSLNCELPKKLGLQTSIYTREPYYKYLRLQAEQDEDEPEKAE